MEFETWLSFCSIALLATATPGPAVLLVSIHSLSFGFRMSLATVLGNVTALLIMSAVSVLGLTALVVYSAFSFTLVKIIGAGYLVYLGVKLWKSGIHFEPPTVNRDSRGKLVALYGQGLLVALTNPKAIVFTTALFPQFIVTSEPLMPQFSVLIVTFMALSFVCLTTYSVLANRTKIKFSGRLSSRLLGKLFGGTFIGAGFFLASTSR